MLVSLVAGFSIVISITSGNWGVQESVVTLISILVGAGIEQGLAATLLIRAATLVLALTLESVFSYILMRQVAIDVVWCLSADSAVGDSESRKPDRIRPC